MKQTITQVSRNSRLSQWIPVAILLGVVGLTLSACDSSDPIQEVRKNIAAGNPAAALAPLRDLIELDSDNAEYLFLYGRALTATGQPGLAEWPLRKAMEDPDWYERAAMQVAATTMAGGNFDNAADLYAEILERNPENLEARLQRANACSASPMRQEEALAEVAKILEDKPDELRAYKPRILAYLALDQPEEAQQAIDELGTRIDEVDGEEGIRGWHCATNAIFAFESGETALASERWAVCEEKFPAHPNVVEKSIEYHNGRGEQERSLEIAQAAFAIDASQDSGYRMQVAQLLRFHGKFDEAEALMLEGVEAAEGDKKASSAAALLALTQHYQTVGQLKAAADAHERALELAEEAYGPQPDLVFSLADLLIQINQDQRALELAEKKMTVPAHKTLVRARVAHKRKQYSEALDLYEETSRLWPGNAYAPYHAGRAALVIGDYDRALENLFQSIRVDENATDARLVTGRLLAEQGRWQPGLQAMIVRNAKPTATAYALKVEILARFQGPAAARTAAHQAAKARPPLLGILMETAANASARSKGGDAAWAIIKPDLALDLPTVSKIPILRAAVTYAPGEAELALVKPYVTKVVAAQPDDAAALELEGMLLVREGALDEAEASFRKSLEAPPGRASTQLRLAELMATSDPAGAMDLVSRTMTEFRFDPDLFVAATSALPDGPHLDALLESALEFAPIDNRILMRFAESLDRQGNRDQRALKLAKLAVRLQGGSESEALRDRIQARIDSGSST